MTKSAGEVSLALTQDIFYGDEIIDATLTLKTWSKPIVINLIAIHFTGHLSVDPEMVDEASLAVLKQMPSYSAGSHGAMGSGRLVKKDTSKRCTWAHIERLLSHTVHYSRYSGNACLFSAT